MEFSCSWGNQTIIITSLTILLILTVLFFSFRKLLHYKSAGKKFITLLLSFEILLCISVLIIPMLYMPVKLSVSTDSVVIHRVMGKVSIPFNQIKEVVFYTSTKGKTTKLFGSGGLFGSLGIYKNKESGTFQMYVTNSEAPVFIRTTNGNYVVSCNSPNLFIQEITRHYSETD